MNKERKCSLILTATIDVSGIVGSTVNSVRTRLSQYQEAIEMWANVGGISRIIVCENSGAAAVELRKHIDGLRRKREICLIQYAGQDFDRNLGKGYGEILALGRAEELIGRADDEIFFKVNGRYFVSNIEVILRAAKIDANTSVVGNFRHNLTWMDSRVFGFTSEFLSKYLLPRRHEIDDSKGWYFEHVLAKSVHRAMSDGLTWSMTSEAPSLLGQSGSTGYQYSRSGMRYWKKFWYIKLLRGLLSI